MELTKRLKRISEYVNRGNTVADIGTDHGYIPIYLALNGIVTKAYAMDINKGPLGKAKNNIHMYGVENVVETILSDGLKQLYNKKVDTVIIAGMGGMLIKKILEDSKDILLNIQKLIISPHLDAQQVRRTVHKLGFKIETEDFIEDEGKHYLILVCVKGAEAYDKSIEYKYGKEINKESVAVYKEYLKRQLEINNKVLDKLKNNKAVEAINRLNQLQTENSEIDEVIKWLSK